MVKETTWILFQCGDDTNVFPILLPITMSPAQSARIVCIKSLQAQAAPSH